MRYKYIFREISGSSFTFDTTTNIDFHTLSNTVIAFDDMYINMSNVVFIKKEIINERGKEE